MDSFFNFLDRLRTKPDAVKIQISFWTALAVTGVTAAVWSTTLPARFAEHTEIATNTPIVVEEEGSVRETLTGFFGSVRGQVGSVVESFREQGNMLLDESTDAEQVESAGEQPEEVVSEMTEKEMPEEVILIATSSSKRAE